MTRTRRIGLAAVVVAALAAEAGVPPARAQSGVELGVLTCRSVPGSGINLLIHSTVDVRCVFSMLGGGEERYKGETGIGLGIDLKWNKDEVINFTVLAASSDIRPGSYALAGKYVGAEATATVGVGAGASVLVGGGAKSITLQPLGLETSTGVGVSAGLSYLYIEPDRG